MDNDGTGIAAGVIGSTHLAALGVTDAKLKRGKVYRRQGGLSGDADWLSPGTTNVDTSAKDVVIQCGLITNLTATQHVTFPVAFTYVPLVMVTPRGSSGLYTGGNWYVVSETTTGFDIQTSSANLPTTTWMAIGQI